MTLLFPGFDGQTTIASSDAVFLERMKTRVQTGLLMGRPHRRSRYTVTRHTQQELVFRASDMTTAINVGLNEVTLRAGGNRTVQYSVRYIRWAAYVIGLGLVLGIVLVVAFLFQGIDGRIGRHTFVADPASNGNIGSALFWGFVLFWTLVWPWLLIVIHRPFARNLLDRIIREVDGASAGT